MIKMFINDEEVVSNKELVIKEEMLATPSAILNNCYPKTWEDIKDYTSKFYYPRDYSRCIIGQGSFKYGTNRYAKLNISGIFPTFETNTEKPFDKIQIDGKSTQATRSGKNLFNKNSTFKSNGGATKEVLDTGVRAKLINSGNYRYFSIELGKSEFLGKTITLTRTITNSASNIGQIALYFGNETTQSKKFIFANKESGTSNIYIPNIFPEDCDRVWILFYGNVSGTGNVGDYVDYTNLMITMGATLDNYEDYGVSPSPDYPSEIECVKGKNLFDKDNATTQVGYFSSNGTLKSGGNSTITTSYTSILPNTDMTISGFALEWICFYDKNKNFIERVAGTLKTFNKNAYYIRIQAPTNVFDLSKIQLEKGTVATDYLPYNTIQVKDVGKNLLENRGVSNTSNGITFTVNDDKTILVNGNNDGTANSIFIINNYSLKAGTYILNGCPSGGSSTTYRLAIQKTSGWSVLALDTGSGSKQFTIDEATNIQVAIFIQKGQTISNLLFKPMIRLSSIIDDTYEPYQESTSLFVLDQPLRSLPNGVKDELVIENGRAKIIKRVGKYNITGNEAWALSGTESQPYINFGNYVDNCKYPATTTELPNLLSNYYLQITRNNLYDGHITLSPSGALIIYDTVHNTSLANFKEWLKSAGVVVYYQLATPTEIDLGEVETLSTFKGINNVSLDANMETNMNLTYLWENYKLLFCGIVKNSGNISLNPRYPHFGSFQILDFKTFLSESDTLDFVISNKTITEAIEMVIDAISTYGFILGNIKIFGADDVIGAYSTQNKTAYDVFQYIAEITGSRWFTRLIDEKTIAIDFYDPTLMERGDNLEYNEKYFEDNYVVDLSFSYGSRDYRNKQVILSDEIYASIDYTEVILSNGYQTTFNTENNIGIIKSIYIDNIEKTFATNNEKETGIDAEFYYTPGKSSFESDGSTYPAGTQITITYTPLVRGRQVVYNNDEVARIYAQTGRKGVIARYESRNDILSSKELDKVGQSYIKYKGSPEVILTLTTEEKDLYNIGQIVYFDSPIPELAQDYMIKSKQIKIIMIDEISQKVFFIYELTSSFNAEKEINYFDNQRNKNKGNISVGETITRNIDIENTANIIFKDMTINEASATGNNLLNSVLNSPFVE